MSWRSRSPAETRALARGLASVLDRAGGVVLLIGPLGAGKTVFAKGLAEGLGVEPDALASPTFVIASEHVASRGLQLVHADFYRIEDAAELDAAGLHDWLAPGVWLVVEWGDRFPQALPSDRLEVTLRPGSAPAERSVEARACGERSRATLSRWQQKASAALEK